MLQHPASEPKNSNAEGLTSHVEMKATEESIEVDETPKKIVKKKKSSGDLRDIFQRGEDVHEHGQEEHEAAP